MMRLKKRDIDGFSNIFPFKTMKSDLYFGYYHTIHIVAFDCGKTFKLITKVQSMRLAQLMAPAKVPSP